MKHTLTELYPLATLLENAAGRAGVQVDIVSFGSYPKDVNLQVSLAADRSNEGNERAAVQLLDEMPTLQLIRTDGLIFLEGETNTGLTYRFYPGSGVCKKVQTGTRTVRQPDPEYIANAPLVDVEEPVFEVICA